MDMTKEDEITVTDILGSKVYDVMNAMGAVMKDEQSKREVIELRGVNQHTHKWNRLTITLEEEG